MDKIQRSLEARYDDTKFLLVLRHSEKWRDDIEIHWTSGPEWQDVMSEAQLAICPMEIERPRLCLVPVRT